MKDGVNLEIVAFATDASSSPVFIQSIDMVELQEGFIGQSWVSGLYLISLDAQAGPQSRVSNSKIHTSLFGLLAKGIVQSSI